MDSIVTQLAISVNPSYSSTYVDVSGNIRTAKQSNTYQTNFNQERKDNNLSRNSMRKFKKSIYWLAYLARDKRVYVRELDRYIKFKLSFITLTLPSKQIHTDKEIKRECLNTFLQWLRDQTNIKRYIWRAEIQANGNIHFHITADKFVHYRRIRQAWLRAINKLGYVDRYTAETGKSHPPCTEIKAVKKVKNVAGYLTSYLTNSGDGKNKKQKEEYHSRVIDGMLYGVSKYLSNIKSLVIREGDYLFDTLCQYLNDNAKKAVHLDFVSIHYLSKPMFQEITEVWTEIFGFDWLVDCGFDLDDVGFLSG